MTAWGNVYFNEWYHIGNVGAKVTGEWSRFDYMMKGSGGDKVAAVQELAALLPKDAKWVYFRDEIGNISSSVVQRDPTNVSSLIGFKVSFRKQ